MRSEYQQCQKTKTKRTIRLFFEKNNTGLPPGHLRQHSLIHIGAE